MARLFMLSFLLMLAVSPVGAQDAAAVEQRIEALRQQLRDVTDKQARLQTRREQLDASLRPEEIEKSVAGVGTTDAAALRDQRQQQLEREKAGVDEQLRSLDVSQARLESAVATAEAEAVRLKAASLAPQAAAPGGEPAPVPTPPAVAPAARRNAPSRKGTPRKRHRPRRRA